jgi:hypothetical protein
MARREWRGETKKWMSFEEKDRRSWGGARDRAERRKVERMKCAREDDGVGKEEKGRLRRQSSRDA